MSDVQEKKPADAPPPDKVLRLFDEMLKLSDYLVRNLGSDVQSAREGLNRRDVRGCELQHAVSLAIYHLVAQARVQYVTAREKGWQDKTLDAQVAAIRSPFVKPVEEQKPT